MTITDTKLPMKKFISTIERDTNGFLNVPTLVTVVDPNGCVLSQNPSSRQFYGILGKRHLCHAETGPQGSFWDTLFDGLDVSCSALGWFYYTGKR